MSTPRNRQKLRSTAEWPRLSMSLPHLHPKKCAACGCWDREEILTLWQEHDRDDQPETRYVLLCEPCEKKLIEPHVRLYAPINRNSPAPGAMAICADCRFRDGLWCAKAKSNGGEGVTITAAKPSHGFIDGSRYSGPFAFYAVAPSACSGKSATSAPFSSP